MSISISAALGPQGTQGGKQASLAKPKWNPNKVYKYLEDMNQGLLNYGKQAAGYYRSLISQQEGDGTMSVEDLKKEIKEWFPEYTLTASEPSKVVTGTFYLYIDQSQLRKMASDPEYRAKVYGLMDRELQGKKGCTLQYSDGRNVTSHITGSIFSLCEKNQKFAGAEGIPYRGSCTMDSPASSSKSHIQVRSMSFLYDSMDPAKSAARDRKAAAVKAAEKAEKRRLGQKQATKKMAAKKANEKAVARKELVKEQKVLRAEKQAEAGEVVDELLEQQMGAGAGTFFDSRA